MPLAKTFFSRFGMVADRFGVPWMIVVAPEAAQRIRPGAVDNRRGAQAVRQRRDGCRTDFQLA